MKATQHKTERQVASGREWIESVVDALSQEHCTTVVHVPDELIGHVLKRLDDSFDVIAASREEEAVGIASGAFLGGRLAALMMQNSGLGNASNALAGLALPYQIPMLILISQRGELGEFNVAQVAMGKACRPMLDSLDIQHFTADRQDEVGQVIRGALKLARTTSRPVAVILSSLLTGGKQG